jgi:hypothetical protein
MNLDRTIHIADWGEHHRPCSFLLPANIPGVVKLADVTATPVDWLWPRRIPIGRLTLLVGDSGLGKSLLTLDPGPSAPTRRGVKSASASMR